MFYQQYFFQVYLCFLVHLLLRLNLTKIIIFLSKIGFQFNPTLNQKYLIENQLFNYFLYIH